MTEILEIMSNIGIGLMMLWSFALMVFMVLETRVQNKMMNKCKMTMIIIGKAMILPYILLCVVFAFQHRNNGIILALVAIYVSLSCPKDAYVPPVDPTVNKEGK